MSKLRVIHARTVVGTLQLDDIDAGIPNEDFPARLLKQPVYVTYNRKYFSANVVVEDTTQPGYVDLVLSDKVVLSQDGGTIKGLADAGLVTLVTIPTGALVAPVITTSTHDTTTSAVSAVDNGEVVITGTTLLSYAPDETVVALTDGVTPKSFTATQITTGGGTATATSIVIPAAVHGYASDGSEDLTSITVTANGQDVTAVPTII